jgi:aspartate/methionine/tyrosine aminotransferase
VQQDSYSEIKKIELIIKTNPGYISLAQGTMKINGIPKQIKGHLQKILLTDKTDYYESNWGLKPLQEKLAQTLSKEFNTSITTRQIIMTHGCAGALSILFFSILRAGDEVIIPEPTYPAYISLTKVVHAINIQISCLNKKNPSSVEWELDIDKIKEKTTPKTKIIVFSNPWNPLGIIVPPATLKELVSWCEQKGIYLIVDEAYRNYIFDKTFVSSLAFVSKSEWVISVNTFSKNVAMSGWRIGYLVAPEKITCALARMQDTLLNCLNNISQYAALYALKHPELSTQFHKMISTNKNHAIHLLQPLVEREIFSYVPPSGGFFLFLKTNFLDTTNLCLNLLKKARVGLIPGKSFGPTGGPFLRLCFARTPEVLEEGISRLLKYLI